MISETIILSVLSNISQVIVTALSIYLAIFVFAFSYFWKSKKFKRNTSKRRNKIVICMAVIINLIILLVYIFVFPSREFGIYNYILIGIIIFYFIITGIIFERTKNFFYFELGIITYSAFFAIFSVILGTFILINAITAIPYTAYLEDKFIFDLVISTKLFFILLLISAIYLISFIFIHKVLISKPEEG